jgi:transposase-like protein
MSVIEGSEETAIRRRRRIWTEDEKRRIVAETLMPGASVSIVARRHDINTNMLFTWRRQLGPGRSPATGAAVTFVPATITLLIPEQAAPLFRNDGAPRFRSIAAQHSDQSSPTIPG